MRLAVALVVGQALLCAVIGWMTLGSPRSEPARPSGTAVVDAMGAPPSPPSPPPAVHTSRVLAAPATQARKATSAPAPHRPTSTRATRTASPSPTPSPVPIGAPPDDPAMAPPEPSPPSSPSSPSPSDEVQEPVREGDECRPAGARGRTAEGEDVRCVREWPRRLRWRIV